MPPHSPNKAPIEMARGRGVYRIGLPSSYMPVSTVVVYLRLLPTNDSLLCFLALRQSEIPRVDDIAMGMHIGEALDIMHQVAVREPLSQSSRVFRSC